MIKRSIAVASAALAITAVSGTGANAVVGGSPAGSPPWLAAISSPAYLLRPSGQFCGGVLTAPDKVITAAHCVQLVKSLPWLLTATFGRDDMRDSTGQTVGVGKVWVDPGFSETTVNGDTVEHHDVAVLTLSHPVNRATLPLVGKSFQYPPGAGAQVLGWGTTSESGNSNTRLRSAVIPMVSDDQCAASYGSAFDKSDMVCAGSPGLDTCQYDSGGPLILDGKLAALTSWARGCARPGFPGVYTRLPALEGDPP